MRCLPALALALAACDTFPTPAQLDHATVLAVIADPPVMPPGATSRLSFVAADHQGPITPPATWSLVSTYPDVPPLGAIAANGDGTATYTAPDPVPALPQGVPPADSVQVVVASDPPVTAVKLVIVLGGTTTANPKITDVTLGGASVVGGASLPAGSTADLAVVTDPPPDEHFTYAWYATVGTIDHYQSNPAPIVADAAAEQGWIYVVVRDGQGGAAVRAIQAAVP